MPRRSAGTIVADSLAFNSDEGAAGMSQRGQANQKERLNSGEGRAS